MSDQRIPCVTYARSRPSERRDDFIAMAQQLATEQELERSGYDILARFGDIECARTFYGDDEARPTWEIAVEEAKRVAREQGGCALVILTSGPIGLGDPFLPAESPCWNQENLRVVVCKSLRGTGLSVISLQQAQSQFAKFRDSEKLRQSSGEFDSDPSSEISLVVRYDPLGRCSHAYLSNPLGEPLIVDWQLRRQDKSSVIMERNGYTWETLSVPPKRMIHLRSFFQGEDNRIAHRLRLRRGAQRQRESASIMIDRSMIAGGIFPIIWSPWEPTSLTDDDYLWENRPFIETPRLQMRCWRADDFEAFSRSCNNNKVMKYLGGIQTKEELFDDLDYFLKLGKSGPTYWPLVRKSDSTVIGFCGIIRVEEQTSPVEGEWEIGWRLSHEVWGQGYAFEAASRIVRSAFNEWRKDRLVARIDVQNLASRRLAARLGMKENPTRRHRPEIDDDQVLLVYEISHFEQ